MSHTTRREFVTSTLTSAAAVGAAATLGSLSRAAGPNDTIRIAIVGSGGRINAYLPELAKRKDFTLAAVCDVDESHAQRGAKAAENALHQKPAVLGDYRKIVDDKNIDAVFVSTTHHWHTPIALAMVQANKDVYVEKPMSHVFQEGRLLLDAAKRHKRIVQHGTQMRSSEVTAKAGEVLASGVIGDVKMSKAWSVQLAGTPRPVPDSAPPKGVNYDMWLGPAPSRPFNPLRFHGSWHICRDYGNGDLGNDGAHDLDMARFGLGVTTHPVKITAHGSRVDRRTDPEFPDNMLVTYEYADGRVLVFEDRLFCPYGLNGFDSGNAFYGTKGYMIFSRRGYFQVFFGPDDKKGPGMKGGPGLTEHIANFFDCIRSRKEPNGSAEVAHLSCGLIHLGEIAYRTQKILQFDPKSEKFVGDDQANRMLTKEYRSPYSLPAVG